MKNIDYAAAVARVRFYENFFLTDADIDRLLAAQSDTEITAILAEHGYAVDQPDTAGFSAMLSLRMKEAWERIRQMAPDFSVFHFLLVKNDFHNLKTVLKSTVTDADYRKGCLEPCIVPPEQLADAFGENRYSALPEYMQRPAAQAYEAFAHSGDGQLSDIRLDRGFLEATLFLAQKTNQPFLSELAQKIVTAADIRMAMRAAKTGKSRVLLEEALCETRAIYPKEMIDAAMNGMDALGEYLRRVSEPAADALNESVSAAERWCDNAVTEQVEAAKYVSFGPEPLAAYIIRMEAEVKAVRTVLTGRAAGFSPEEIRTRLRKLG